MSQAGAMWQLDTPDTTSYIFQLLVYSLSYVQIMCAKKVYHYSWRPYLMPDFFLACETGRGRNKPTVAKATLCDITAASALHE